MLPEDTPVTTPVADVIVATEVLLLVQLPLPARLFSVVVPPTHTDVVPVIGPRGFTVRNIVAGQPEPVE